jgi:hypothetical protein
VIKSLASGGLLLVVLAIAAQACGGPSADQASQNLADAQATNVRRTAVADVQRIIANKAASTLTPEATALARPSCPDAIWWHEAVAHVGESHKVQGVIVATRPAPDGAALLEIGQRYPDPTGLAVLVTTGSVPRLDGKTVCVAGRITSAEGRPMIRLSSASGIVLVN